MGYVISDGLISVLQTYGHGYKGSSGGYIAGRKRYGTPYFKALRINRNPFLAVSSI